ncbi:cation diffusion facilitator family transporter [Paenibacillus sp. JCM 10914]|uniref:cation diffusion facilitator family transporter n=1 Tax=Paenibacillus sp. JCM 10914 TaxID=1236974 RepID=UPI0003CC4990|nr:cobalt-zinc-cadmium resistance protein [Paenibacillus sp. JCM 10914]
MVDPLTAFLMGLIICKTAWNIFRDSSHALTDGFDEKKLEEIKATISQITGVKCIKDIKGRVHGNKVFIDVVIGVDPALNVVESHRITEIVEEKIVSPIVIFIIEPE